MDPQDHIRQLGDHDLQFLEEVAALLDRRLDELDREIDDHLDPDGCGLLDTWDSTVALGFVACQNYLSAVIGKKCKDDDSARKRRCDQSTHKAECLALGPEHAKGPSLATIINAGANYAKHHPEGRLDHHVIDVLRRMGVWKRGQDGGDERAIDYPLGNLLFEMLSPAPDRFRDVLLLLEQWRDAVIKAGLA